MKEHGMLFRPEMIKAILEESKTMTRRVIKPQPLQYEAGNSQKYNIGEIIYVKEAIEKKSPLFMRKIDARIWLEITDVKVERLQDISEADATREGVELIYPNENLWKNYLKSTPLCDSAHQSFISLWHSIHKSDHIYKPMQWVWVIEFKRIKN